MTTGAVQISPASSPLSRGAPNFIAYACPGCHRDCEGELNNQAREAHLYVPTTQWTFPKTEASQRCHAEASRAFIASQKMRPGICMHAHSKAIIENTE